jgi:hypothetical protein
MGTCPNILWDWLTHFGPEACVHGRLQRPCQLVILQSITNEHTGPPPYVA